MSGRFSRRGRSILFRATMLSWLVIVFTLGAYMSLIIPRQKSSLINELNSKALLIATSISLAIAPAAIMEDYSPIIEHCMQVVKENPSVLYVVITRRDGFSIVHTRRGWEDRKLSGTWTPKPAGISNGTFTQSPLVREKVFNFSYPVKYSGIEWGWIHIGLSVENFYSELRFLYTSTVLLFLLCILGGLVLSYLFARQLTMPIFVLHGITQQLKEGDLSARASISSGDELEALGNSFNQMAEALQRSHKNLEEAKNELARSLDELKDAELQLVQAEKMSAVGQLAAGVAHEINNPLSGILAHAKLLQELLTKIDAGDDKYLKKFPGFLEIILESTYRCKDIVEDLLSFSRHSKSDPEDPIDINEVLEKSLNLLSNQLNLNAIRVKKDLSTDLAKVKGNFNRLQQVFVNLILNSCQFMPRGGEIAIETRMADSRYVLAVLNDTGSGISADNLDKIFEPFFTTRSVSQGSGGGTGLGLSITYGIIKEHRGFIDVSSEEGKGTSFRIRLPVLPKDETGERDAKDQNTCHR
jgi:signal transduction histidine kinase